VVVAYLGTCASYAELASLPWRRWGLVVSERLAFSGWFKGFGYLRKNLHILADAVIANSHTNRLMIEKSFPWLKGKTITIYNVIDNKIFTYAESHINKNNIQIVMACRIHHQKNILGLIEAFALIKNNPQNYRISVDIYGSPGPDSLYINKCLDAIKTWNLQDYVKLHKPHNNIVAVYRQADAVLLPSFWEGLPNTICEAMSCGKPILMSNACDAGNLVEQGENGFLFDPHDTASMAAAIFKFAALTPAKRHKMGVRSRYKAERLFDLQTIADRFENLLFCATQRKKIPINHWPPEVPQTAFRYTELDALS
jgi:glycosyltransferase involved in cell wall biosynthesis